MSLFIILDTLEDEQLNKMIRKITGLLKAKYRSFENKIFTITLMQKVIKLIIDVLLLQC